ncbi:hypothetical protein F5Y19DRAFT_211592 [Xylariaceae sp. FL1651]|nr:hypothetical protein F5Y19DRAFT_211592 [Xylariaceae sp. FL1651]
MPSSKACTRLQADIKAAGEVAIPNIQRIRNGDVQDEFVFTFTHPQIPLGQVEIRVMPQEAAGYPGDNFFLVYTNDEIPTEVGMILDDAMTSTAGMLVTDMLQKLSRRLRASLDAADNREDDDAIMTDADVDVDLSEDEDDSDTDIPFEYDDDDNFGLLNVTRVVTHKSIPALTLQRIRQDLQSVRAAGFKVGKILGVDQVSEYSIVTMSIRVSRLGLSEETRGAWNLASSDYVILLMKYEGEYTTFEDALRKPAASTHLEFRLRKCSKYRPALSQAITAFSRPGSKSNAQKTALEPVNDHEAQPADWELSPFGVGDSIDLLLNNDFVGMMKIRKKEGVSWDEAKKMHSQLTITNSWNTDALKVPISDTKGTNNADANLPPILINDHLLNENTISLPLVAIQFALRYLVKCTEYCMICHEKVAGNFEALKPYVCSKPLCLFQYMNLGLGPSIDHEIVNQQYVVDLLISFCYASLQHEPGTKPRLREYPLGLNLQVPRVRSFTSTKKPETYYTIRDYGLLENPVEVQVSWDTCTVTVTDPSKMNHPGLTTGQWVIIYTSHSSEDISAQPALQIFHHARIEHKFDSVFGLHIACRHPVPMDLIGYEKVKIGNWATGLMTGHLVSYNQSLDDLEMEEEQAFSLTLLLASLPPVDEMRAYLMENQSRQLATWSRIPPAAMKLLRWIVASNRSLIVQIDNCVAKDEDSSNESLDRSCEKISGVDGWIQFRFAQGSPEKEALFQEALKDVNKPQRTLLAWHGSPLGNWHSIIRQGLNFSVVAHGRAYGDGVYFSRSFDYSMAYAAPFPVSINTRSPGTQPYTQRTETFWPQSSLRITQAISLNELVNLPEKFKQSNACFVVDTLHWIQCRYLFVRSLSYDSSKDNSTQIDDDSDLEEYEQDPNYFATGPQNRKLIIPKLAISSGQQQQFQKTPFSVSDEMSGDERFNDTDDEDLEDIEFLHHEARLEGPEVSLELDFSDGLPPTPTHQEFLTDFRPGILDFSNLPQLAFPTYATKAAQQTIQRELQKLQKVQCTTPLHELGWYIDFDRITNMFQWIVELHSFDPSLPLAQDMKVAGITSIILEIRFLRGFPMTPPFVRVIQPQFIPFSMGGGGHVTAGGAMCMELLTNTGWSPVSSMESVLLQVRLAMCNLDPRPARLVKSSYGSTTQYSVTEAVNAFTRAAQLHGWEVPAELGEATTQ